MSDPLHPYDQTGQSEKSAFDSSTDGEGNLGERAAEAAQAAKEQIATAAEPVADAARHLVEEKKQSGAKHIGEAARAVHSAADDIGKQSPQLAGYVHSGAEQLERASQLLRENSVDDLLQMTSRLARERPLAFIGGSVAAGFVLARFLKSSASARSASAPGERR